MSGEQRHPDDEEVEHSGERRPAESGGALTGATGSLTSGDFGTEPFVPGERREIDDPIRAGRMTDALARHAGVEPAGSRLDAKDAADPGAVQGSGGYGSSQGLSPDDPAYRVDRQPDASPHASGSRRDDSDTYAEGEEHL
ncbi:MAG: hypothetical protein ABI534_05330 [Chloroflexota bacterium]